MGYLYAFFSMLTNFTGLTNLLARNSHLWPPYTNRQQSTNLFIPKKSRQISVVDFIQQYLPIRKWHHQSRLLLCAFINQLKPVFRYNMELSITPMSSTSQLPHFCIWWIPYGLINTCQEEGFNNQRWKKGLVMFSISKNMSIHTQTTPWVVISHSKC